MRFHLVANSLLLPSWIGFFGSVSIHILVIFRTALTSSVIQHRITRGSHTASSSCRAYRTLVCFDAILPGCRWSHWRGNCCKYSAIVGPLVGSRDD